VAEVNQQQTTSTHLNPSGEDITACLKQDILSGKHWYMALLEAVRLWPVAEETIGERHLRYLVDGEALYWLLLAERLCQSVDGLLPEDEKTDLLLHGKPPLELTTGEFREAIGLSKHNQYLNYFYGITAEEALIQAVEDEVCKEKQAFGLSGEQDTTDIAYHRVYGATQSELLSRFRCQRAYPHASSIGLEELKEFTYWLFGYRLRHCDKERVASDTKKALKWLKKNARGKG
jgi:hypothetical protein